MISRRLTPQEEALNQQSNAVVDLFERIHAPSNAWIKKDRLLLSAPPEKARGSMTFSPDGSVNIEQAAANRRPLFQGQSTITLGML